MAEKTDRIRENKADMFDTEILERIGFDEEGKRWIEPLPVVDAYTGA